MMNVWRPLANEIKLRLNGSAIGTG